MRLLAVELHEGTAVFEHLLAAGDLAQQVGDAHLDPAIAAYVQLPAGVDRDHAEVLDGGLGTIARTAGDRHLELVRGPRAPTEFFQVDAHLDRVLGAKTAELAADAGLDRAQGLAVGVAGDHPGTVQLTPDRR